MLKRAAKTSPSQPRSTGSIEHASTPKGTIIMRTALLILTVALLTACDKSNSSSSPGDGKPKIVATTTMIGDLVGQIAGDKVDLATLMPPGTDPHTYKPTTKDLADISRATLVFYNGLHLEGKMVELFEEKMKKTAVAVSLDEPKDKLLDWPEDEGGTYDPHIWFDPTLWKVAAKTVRDELARIDPGNAAHYDARVNGLVTRLDQLDAYIAERLGRIPSERKVLITSHDAFNYYGKRYKLE